MASEHGITYIAGPMSGIEGHNYPAFNEVARRLRAEGRQVRNPAEVDGGSEDKSWQFYMRLGLALLLECDEVVLLPGWQKSRGATLERHVAEQLGMTIVELPE